MQPQPPTPLAESLSGPIESGTFHNEDTRSQCVVKPDQAEKLRLVDDQDRQANLYRHAHFALEGAEGAFEGWTDDRPRCRWAMPDVERREAGRVAAVVPASQYHWTSALGTRPQSQLAAQAGVSKNTVQRLESGSVATQLSGFIRVCRVLDLIERFDLFVPEPVPSPVEQLKLRGRRRQRASARRKANAPAKKWLDIIDTNAATETQRFCRVKGP